ncbi:hypothetical protein B9Z55_008149 [Caenorhabditis nigoni]|nr:hypothetical protein B9Z55_008149 [Caenorhabditis nigoni]
MSSLPVPTLKIQGRTCHFPGPLPPWFHQVKAQQEQDEREQRDTGAPSDQSVLEAVEALRRLSLQLPTKDEPSHMALLKFDSEQLLINGQKISPIVPGRQVHMKRLSALLGTNVTHTVETVSVKNLDVLGGLPRNIKLQASIFVLYDDTKETYEILRKWIQPSSFPLKAIGIEIASPMDAVFQNLITASDCKKLSVFLPMCATGPGDWADPFIRLQHPFFEITEAPSQIFSIGNFLGIVYNWMEHPRPLGHKIGLLTRNVELYFEGVKSKLGAKALKTGGSVVFPNVFLLPMSGSKSLELVISGSKSPYFEKELMSPNPVLWMVQMEVNEQQQQGSTRGN